MVEQVLVGAVAAGIFAIFGWWKKNRSTVTAEDFNTKRAVLTVLAGTVAGILAYYANVPIDNAIEIVVLGFGTIGLTETTAAKTIKSVSE